MASFRPQLTEQSSILRKKNILCKLQQNENEATELNEISFLIHAIPKIYQQKNSEELKRITDIKQK